MLVPLIEPLRLLLLSVVLVITPHLLRLPLWLAAIAIALLGWRTWAAARNERLPRKPLLFACVGAGIFAIFMHYQSLFGRDAGVAMLVLFLGLKLLETRHERDVVVVAFLSYFLLLANFFYTQSVWAAAHAVVAAVMLTAALVGFNSPKRSWRHHFGVAGTLLGTGLPLAMILFVLFPRFEGPLWRLPSLGGEASVGLSETMTPGDISRLSQSDAIAFRARFDQAPPPRAALYWRGPVLWDFDGRTWNPSQSLPMTENFRVHGTGDAIAYEIILEPHERNWLFALELPAFAPPEARATADYQLLSRRPVRARMRYRTQSYLSYRAVSGASHQELRAALALPEGFNPRTIGLAREWRLELRSDVAIIERALAYFGAQGIAYTTTPPPLGRHTVDEFLFETKQGFCEHFSAAFVVLMRAAHIPARVVTGYQGGTMNPFDDNVVVRQADAHAWAEVWIDGHGWRRVDPTAAAAPARVQMGLAAAIGDKEALPFMLRPTIPWLADLRLNLEALANYWNQWVIGYNATRQRQLLSQLGMPRATASELTRMLLFVGAAVLGLLVLLMLRERGPQDPAQRAWLRGCAKLARAGLARQPAEGPLAFAARVSRSRPDLAADITEIARLYVSARYGRGSDAQALRALQQAVRALRPSAGGLAWMRRLWPAAGVAALIVTADGSAPVWAQPRSPSPTSGATRPETLAQIQQPAPDAGGYHRRAEVLAFVQSIVERHGIPREQVLRIIGQARHQPAIVRAMQPVVSGQRSWQGYRSRTVHPARIESGIAFWQQYRATLARARATFGIPEEIIVAIIGIETEYGRNMGTWRVLDALATLAFDYPRRADFFRGELEHLFLYTRETGTDVFSLRGSYAGAIGIPQFMPSSFMRYAVDFDGDGRRDLVRNPVDAIGSVGNFLKHHGWRSGEPVAAPVGVDGSAHTLLLDAGIEPRFRVGELEHYGISLTQALDEDALCALMEFDTPEQPSEFWIGLQNFYVITRYNQSSFYALSVFQTAQAIRAEMERRTAAR